MSHGLARRGEVGHEISICWADEYDISLSGQWIDITGLRRGNYVLEVEVNAERFFEEFDYSNNSAAISLSIPRQRRAR